MGNVNKTKKGVPALHAMPTVHSAYSAYYING